MRRRSLTAVLAAVPLFLSATAGAAMADQVTNTLDGTIDTTAEVMPLNVGGASATTDLYVKPTQDDGNKGCNLSNTKSLTVAVSSSDTKVATVSPSSLTFQDCGTHAQITVTPVGQGSSTVSLAVTANNASGTFDLDPATFTVNVAAPANTAPSVSIGGVTGGASYNKGSVPAATCVVTDAEDGTSSFAATLSTVSGKYASDGIGSQTASCSYTDKGGLTASSSVTYNIVDPSAPSVSYTLNPAAPNGANDWYTGDVSLTWKVGDADSPNSLTTTGCENQTITSDQDVTTYTCAASSAGGMTAPTTVTIKRDAHAPNAPTYTLDPEPNTAGWNNSDVKVTFAGHGDNGPSGFAACSDPVTVSTEGASQTVTGYCWDNAGNPSAGTTVYVNLDKTAPDVTYDKVVTGTLGDNDWYTSDVEVQFKATDALAGPASQTASETSSGEGADVVVNSPVFTDAAGNTAPAGSASRSFKIDKTAPTDIAFDPVDGVEVAAGGTYYWGSVPKVPTTCSAVDDASGASCVVTGADDPGAVGDHTITATATNGAGLSDTKTLSYSVLKWTLKGFYAPVDMSGVWNTVKGGSTVPLKFEVFSDHELTDTSVVASLKQQQVTCPGTSAITDAIEVTSTGGTSLRYDTTAGQFIQNWQTPKVAGDCYVVTMTTQDGSKLQANFKLK